MGPALRLAPLGRKLPLPGRLGAMTEIAPPWRSTERPERITPAGGETRGRVGILTGCVQSVVFGSVNAATARVLAADGYEVVAPPQGCCGALSMHAGRGEEGRAFARRVIEAFDDVETVIVNTSGCGSHLKELGHVLGDDPAWAERAAAFSTRVRDLGEFLTEVEPRASRHPLNLKVAMQDSCHLRHAQRLPLSSAVSLRRIPGLTVVEPAEQDICCGSAGIYNITAGRRGPAARRPQGRPRARDRSSGLRERQPRLPRPGRDRTPPGRQPTAGPASDRDRRRLDPEPRRGGPVAPGPPLDLSGSDERVGEVDREVAGEGHRSDSNRGPGHERDRGRHPGPAQPSSAPPPARIGVSPDQNASTATRPRIESVSAVAPAASRCRPRGTTHPNTTAAATAMIAQTTRNSLLPCSSGPAQVPTAASTVASPIAPIATGAMTRSEMVLLMSLTPSVVDSSSVGPRCTAVVAAERYSPSPSEAISTWLLRAMPSGSDWRTVRRMRALRLVRDHADLAFARVLHGGDADRGLVRGL